MVDFDGGIESKFCSIVDADVGIKPTELAARDYRMELYTRYAFDIGDASELLAQVMSDYCLDPDQMMDVVRLGEQALRSGAYSG